jgi:hydroxypyruvate reductase
LPLDRDRQGQVTTSPNVLADDVADLAIGLWLGSSRGVVNADPYVRMGQWRTDDPFPFTRNASGRRALGPRSPA